MGGPFTFLASLFSFGASAGISLKEQSEVEAKNREWKSHKYSHYIQEDYDLALAKMIYTYDFDKIEEAIKEDFPQMNDNWTYKIAKTAVAKKMMEEETDYEYKIPDDLKSFNLNKYAANEFKRKEYGYGIY